MVSSRGVTFALPPSHRFEILQPLGAGGMGSVFAAFDRTNNTRVALKVLSSLSPERLRLFKNEFRLLQDMAHPNLVRLGELFEHESLWFLTMELIDGVDFLSYVRKLPASEAPEKAISELLPTSDAGSFAPPEQGIQSEPNVQILSPSAVGVCDEGRLRPALVQLLSGISTLHASHKIHRDLKPSNVMVTSRGRVVILDFGIASSLREDEYGSQAEGTVMGTLSYMAPEQALGQRLTPAADLYAIGVMLYQSLVGRLPFAGTPEEVIRHKCQQKPPPVQLLARAASDLCAICEELLQIDPAQRPTAVEVLKRLDAQADTAAAETAKIDRFVGRKHELAFLQESFSRTRKGKPAVVLVSGESGVGKSALVKHFLERLVAQTHKIAIFRSRCYEREAVSFKAIDGIIDAMSLYLQQLGKVEVAALLPDAFPCLAQLFPVLQPLLSRREFGRIEIAEPTERRRQGFAALRELLIRLTRGASVVLVIDDLQWGDDDSFELLAELFRPEVAPPLLLLATMRTKSTGTDQQRGPGLGLIKTDIQNLALEKLSGDDARQLVEELLGGKNDPELREWVERIVDEAKGHPLFIDELMRSRGRVEQGHGLHLDEALWLRIKQLEPTARQLIELVAMSGVPLEQEVALQAGAFDAETFDAQIAILRAERLCCTEGAKRTDCIEPYHDRVRESVIAHLDAERQSQWHGRLALVLERRPNAEPVQLMLHWEGAGQPARAGEYALAAAKLAEQTLAFEHAARLYRRAIELMQPRGERLRELRIQLGEAQIHANRGYEGAAELMLAATDAPPEQASRLRARAGEQFVAMGYFDRGLDLLNQSLRDLGVRILRSKILIMLSIIICRLWLKLRGFHFQEVPPEKIPREEHYKLDALYNYGRAISGIAGLLSGEASNRALMRSLKVGSARHVAMGLLSEATSMAALGGTKTWAYSEELFQKSRALAANTNDPYLLTQYSELDSARHYLCGSFQRASELAMEAERALMTRCTGHSMLLVNVRSYTFLSSFYSGDLSRYPERLPDIMRDMEARNDLCGQCFVRSWSSPVLHLMNDEPVAAMRDFDWCLQNWQAKDQGLPILYVNQWIPQVLLYERKGKEAQVYVETRIPWPIRSTIPLVISMKLYFAELRARCAIAAALEAESGRRAKLLKRASRLAAQILASTEKWAVPLGLLLRAAIFFEQRDSRGACAALKEAASGFAAHGMKLHAAVARIRLGQLQDSESERTGAHSAMEWLRSQGIVNIERWVDMLAPGFSGTTQIAKSRPGNTEDA